MTMPAPSKAAIPSATNNNTHAPTGNNAAGTGRTTSSSTFTSNTGLNTDTSSTTSVCRTRPCFEGHTDELKGFVFEMNSSPAQYPHTLEKLHLYAGVTYAETPEITSLFNDMPMAPGVTPTAMRTNGSVTLFDEELFKQEV